MGRLDYQRKWATGFTLNIGCGDNPAGIGNVQLDLDVWRHDNFVWGDAHHLPFKDSSFDTVVLGDMLEHALHPEQVLEEAKRVTRSRIVITVPKEAIPHSTGQHIEEGRRIFCAETPHPKRICKFPESTISHGPAINSFSEEWLKSLIEPLGMAILDWHFVPEHDWMNWLICLKRRK